MRQTVFGFALGLIAATAGWVGAQGFMDLESGTMYQEVPGGLMNMRTGEMRLTAPLGQPLEGQKNLGIRPPC